MVARAFLALVALLPFVLANNYVVLESRQALPKAWSHHETISAEEAQTFALPMRVGLTQNNLHQIEDMLMSVSDPDSPSFSDHYSAQEIVDTFAPPQDRIDRVRAWIANAGVHHDDIKLSLNKGWLEFPSTIAQAETLLRTKYHVYQHREGQKHVACESYSVPAEIQHDIDLITPTLHFDAAPEQYIKFAAVERDIQSKAARLAKRFLPNVPGQPRYGSVTHAVVYPTNPTTNITQCGSRITPPCLEALYDFNPETIYEQASHNCKKGCDSKSKKHHKRWGKEKKHPKPTCKPKTDPNAFGIVEYTPNYMNYQDNAQFFSVYAPKAKNFQPAFKPFDGATNNQTKPEGGINEYFAMFGEGNLDFQYAGVLAYPAVPIEYFQVGRQNDFNNSFNNLLDAIDRSYCTYKGGDDPNFDDVIPLNQCGIYKAPKVLSTSYGYNELDLTPRYEKRQCNEYAKLGMHGTSFFFSSGDNGVAGNLNQCTSSTVFDPTYSEYTNGTLGGLFNPAFPSTCPYITSVGATQLPPNSNVNTREEVANGLIRSGGGFSNVFGRPSYQKQAVAHYLATNKQLPTVNGSAPYNTSYSRAYPDLSANGQNYSVFYNNNTFRVSGTSASCPVVATIFSLINFERLQQGKKSVGFINPTIYKNPGVFNDIVAGSNPGCATDGFFAQKGWDPATGLGTPNFPKLSKLYAKLK